MAFTAFDSSTALGASLNSLQLIETLTDNVILQGASLNQDLDAAGGTLNVVDIYWRIPGRPGMMTTRVPFESNWTAIAFYYIGVKQALVRGIYDGLPNKAALPVGPPAPLLPPPGVPF